MLVGKKWNKVASALDEFYRPQRLRFSLSYLLVILITLFSLLLIAHCLLEDPIVLPENVYNIDLTGVMLSMLG
jgi:hypothetical protein